MNTMDKLEPLTAQEALNELTKYFLGDDFYVVDPLGPTQVNAIIVDEIKSRYKGINTKKKKKFFSLFG